MIIRDDVVSDVIRPGSTIREDHIDTPYRGTLCLNIVQFWQELPDKKHFKEKHHHHYDVILSRDGKIAITSISSTSARDIIIIIFYTHSKKPVGMNTEAVADRQNDRTKDRQTREVNIRVAKAELWRTNNNS